MPSEEDLKKMNMDELVAHIEELIDQQVAEAEHKGNPLLEAAVERARTAQLRRSEEAQRQWAAEQLREQAALRQSMGGYGDYRVTATPLPNLPITSSQKELDKLLSGSPNALNSARVPRHPHGFPYGYPQYKSHKVVSAFKIEGFLMGPHSNDPDLEVIVGLRGEGFEQLVLTEWVTKHKPEVGGYYVVYGDGYRSYSPARAFEEGYTRLGLYEEPKDLRGELTQLLNRYCCENVSDTPDFILCQFIFDSLKAFNAATRERDTFHGIEHPQPGGEVKA